MLSNYEILGKYFGGGYLLYNKLINIYTSSNYSFFSVNTRVQALQNNIPEVENLELNKNLTTKGTKYERRKIIIL